MKEVDLDVAELYSKEKCKKCWGKGYLKYHTGAYSKTIRKAEGFRVLYDYCDCVRKMKKELSSDET
jgi:hypothetical protein